MADTEREFKKLRKKKRNKRHAEILVKKQELGAIKQDLNILEDKYSRVEIKDQIKKELKEKGLSPKFISRRSPGRAD